MQEYDFSFKYLLFVTKTALRSYRFPQNTRCCQAGCSNSPAFGFQASAHHLKSIWQISGNMLIITPLIMFTGERRKEGCIVYNETFNRCKFPAADSAP